MMESFQSNTQNELRNRKKWKTRLESTNTKFDYIENSAINAVDTRSLTMLRQSSSSYRSMRKRLPEFKEKLGNETQCRSRCQLKPSAAPIQSLRIPEWFVILIDTKPKL